MAEPNSSEIGLLHRDEAASADAAGREGIGGEASKIKRPPYGGSPRLTRARSSSSFKRFPRSLIGAIESSARFRQSRHECRP